MPQSKQKDILSIVLDARSLIPGCQQGHALSEGNRFHPVAYKHITSVSAFVPTWYFLSVSLSVSLLLCLFLGGQSLLLCLFLGGQDWPPNLDYIFRDPISKEGPIHRKLGVRIPAYLLRGHNSTHNRGESNDCTMTIDLAPQLDAGPTISHLRHGSLVFFPTFFFFFFLILFIFLFFKF